MVHPTPAWTSMGVWPRVAQVHPVRYQSQAIVDTMENSVCSKQPVLAECLSMECHSIDQTGRGVVLALVPVQGKRVSVPRSLPGVGGLRLACRGKGRATSVAWTPAPPVVAASSGHDGITQGERYCSARGEILRPLQDQQRRRRSARVCPSIKSESLGIEDDQTPS